MKKILFLTGLCLTIVASAFAQDFQGRQGGQRGPRRQMDAVVDTAIINHMDLSAEVLQKVYELQAAKQAEQQENMAQGRKRGQRLNPEEIQAMTEKMKTFTAQYRQELRAILGDEAYIVYLEKMLDNRSMMRMGNMRGNRGGNMPQGGFPNGGFQGGGDFNGGGFPGGGF